MPKMEKKIRSLNIKINKYSRIIQRVALITTYQFLNKLKIPKGVKRIKIIKGTYNPKKDLEFLEDSGNRAPYLRSIKYLIQADIIIGKLEKMI